MKVDDICSRRIRTIDMTGSLNDAGEQMRRHRIDALVVTEPLRGTRRPIGLITDQELVVAFTAKGPASGAITVGEVAVRRLVTVPAGAGVKEAIQIMRDSKLRRLAVESAEGELIGILALDELLEALGTQLIGLAKALRDEKPGLSAPPRAAPARRRKSPPGRPDQNPTGRLSRRASEAAA